MMFCVAYFVDFYGIHCYRLPFATRLTYFYGEVIEGLDPFSCRINDYFGLYAENSCAQSENG